MRRAMADSLGLRYGHWPTRRGFTLAEALIASTILAIVAASVSLPFVAVTQQMIGAREVEIAVDLGEELMEEILARPFYAPGETAPTPGPEADEKQRKYFDSVDDFSDYTEYKGTKATQHLEDYRGVAVTDDDMNGYWRKVRIEYVRMADQATDDSDYSFVRITVGVYRDRRLLFTLVRIKTREY